MTHKEAARILRGAIKKPNTEDSYMGQALSLAVEALEKQIPKKFKMIDDCIPICPVCGEAIWAMKWCTNCGQRLDTEESDD